MLFAPQSADDVALVSPRRLSKLATGATTLSASQIERAARVLDRDLQPATDAGSSRASNTSRSSAARRSEPPASGASATRRPGGHEQPHAVAGDVLVKPWSQYGKDRLYVNLADGTTLGYVDLQSNAVVPVEERHRQTVTDAVARYLREN